jgi:hypothetical protein
MFAKHFARSDNGLAWWAFVDDVREALIDTFVLNIVFSQDKGEVGIEDIRALRARIVHRLGSKHGLISSSYKNTIGIG